jgi:LPXTG-motif cell wall-anchored protein
MRRLLASLAVAGAFVVPATPAYSASGGTVHPQQAHPGLGIRLLEAPTALANDPRARIYIIDHLAPGTTITRKVQVSDGTTNPLDVSLYAAGSQIKGGLWSPYQGRTPDELSQWVSMSPALVHLEPGQSTVVEATIAVPADASSAERYAVLWAEARIPGTGPVHEVARAGVRVYLSVGPGGAPPTDFRIDTMSGARTNDGRPEVLAQVHNIGGRAIDISGSLRLLDGPGALTAGPFPAKLGTTLAPGQSEAVTVVLDKALPAGPWAARIVLQSDLVKRAAKATITFPTGSGVVGPRVKAVPVPLTKNRHVLVPLAIGLIALLAIGLLLWRRRRRHDDNHPLTATYAAITTP